MKRAFIIFAFVAVGIIFPTNAMAAVRHIDASCGMHRGKILLVGVHRYHVRIGPKHSGGRNHCHGRVHRGNNHRGILGGDWVSFNLPSWNWRGVLEVGSSSVFTAAACTSFVGAFVGEVPTIGTDTGATVLTGAACVAGGKSLQDSIRTMMRPRG